MTKPCIFNAPADALEVLDEYVDLRREVDGLAQAEFSRQRILVALVNAEAERLRPEVARLRKEAAKRRAAAKRRGEVVPNRGGLAKDRVEAALKAAAKERAAGRTGKTHVQIGEEEGVTPAYVSRIAARLGIFVRPRRT